jgi:maltose O-acetyltransferase
VSVVERLVETIAHIPKLHTILYRCFLSWPDWPKPLTSQLRAAYWRVFMKSLGKGSRISHKVKVLSAPNISIGDEVHITNNVILDGRGGITIGDDVLVGYESIIMTSMRNYRDPDVPVRLQGSTRKPVVIGRDVWLGTRVIVLPGAKIGDGAIVGSGAVVTKDVPPFSVVAGVPAETIGKRGQ